MGKKDPRVDAYIVKSADFAKPILNHIRKLVHAACPDVEETMKWSFPHFMYKGMLCSMASFKEHCAFGFWKGEKIVGRENIGRDVKLGPGGIREIEFVVQALQLLHGARHAFLQETSTLKALPILAQLELIPGAEARALEFAYRFLRRVEHRLQIEAEQQTHTVPENGAALDQLARSLGFASKEKFTAALRK